VVDFCEHGAEPSGSGATELVKDFSSSSDYTASDDRITGE
jgi:hypothetical protein